MLLEGEQDASLVTIGLITMFVGDPVNVYLRHKFFHRTRMPFVRKRPFPFQIKQVMRGFMHIPMSRIREVSSQWWWQTGSDWHVMRPKS
jgi:hypothetical protein